MNTVAGAGLVASSVDGRIDVPDGKLTLSATARGLRIGRTLLTLDTETRSDADRLYRGLGWTKFGEVPGYAMSADGKRRETCSFFYKEL